MKILMTPRKIPQHDADIFCLPMNFWPGINLLMSNNRGACDPQCVRQVSWSHCVEVEGH